MTHVEAESMRKRFYKAIANTTIDNGDYIVPYLPDSDRKVVIKFTTQDENKYPINVMKTFSDVSELESFVTMLEQLKILGQSKEYKIELIPVNGVDVDVYLNGEKVPGTSIQNYVAMAKTISSAKVGQQLMDIQSVCRQMEYLIDQLNDTQRNLNKVENLITAVKGTENRKKQEQYVKDHTPIRLEATLSGVQYEYVLDLAYVVDLAKQYADADKKEQEMIEERMNDFLSVLQQAIEDGKRITNNYYDVYNIFSPADFMILEDFLSQLQIKLEQMQSGIQQNLDIKQKTLNVQTAQINSAIGNKKDLVDTIKGMQVISTKLQPINLQSTRPVTKERFVTYNNGQFSKEMQSTDEAFADIQLQQLQKLTTDERDALMYYKTMMYRPINEVIAFIRKHGLTLKEVGKDQEILEHVIQLISNCYDEFIKRKEELENSIVGKFQKLHILSGASKSVDRLFGKFPDKTPSKKEYIEIVIASIPLVESALAKVTAPKDIIVYRSSPQNALVEDGRFLSTSLSLSTAKMFTSDADRYKGEETKFPNIFKVTIPAGSPLIAFTDDLYTDDYNENFVFNEYQYEILIDPKHYNFKPTYMNSQRVNDNLVATRIDYTATPREILFTDDITRKI